MSDVKVWNTQNLDSLSKKRFFPAEMVMRSLFSTSYFDSMNKQAEGTVLDIGSLFGNNLVPFSDRGWQLFGTEVTHESVEISKQCCGSQGIEAEIKLGFNRDLPFESEKFDILLSMSTIHYEESLSDVARALGEFNRVLVDDGCALVQTVAPNHSLFLKSNALSQSVYRLNNKDDIRDGQLFTFFKESSEFVNIASDFFKDIEVARCTEMYPNYAYDVWLFKMIK